MTEFTMAVIEVIKNVPRGSAASYGQVAKWAGKPGAARTVSWVLHSCSKKYKLPWHRIVNSKGMVSFPKGSKNYRDQLSLLKKEGVEVDEGGRVSLMEKKPRQKKTKTRRKKVKTKGPHLFRDD